MNAYATPSSAGSRRRLLPNGFKQLRDRLMLTVYGGITADDLARYSNQPDTLAGVIATRTGRSRRAVRAWLENAPQSWHHA